MKYIILFISLWGFSALLNAQVILDSIPEYTNKTYSQRWELESDQRRGTFRLMSYKPIFVTAARWSSNPNNLPQSENPDYSATEPTEYNQLEAKFQLSFKTKVFQGMFWDKGDLWIGYTQKAHWQVYNVNISRAFRELNYEPELIFKYPIDMKFLGGRFKSVGVMFNHQSNGGNLPNSRSWNRIIFHLGYEWDRWIVTLQPWIRLSDTDDENPLITNYIGNGEINVAYSYKRHQFYSIITHPFDRWQGGSIQLNYVFPIKGNLRGHAQLFEGYGETLIDYNHKQTTFGLGVSFANW